MKKNTNKHYGNVKYRTQNNKIAKNFFLRTRTLEIRIHIDIILIY